MSKNPDTPRIRPFADVLLEMSAGRTHLELGEKLHELIARVRDTGKKGSLTLTISVAPMKNNTSNLVVTDMVAAKLPALDRQTSVFWADRDGNLSRTDPNQLAFESLKEVPPVDVDITTGEIREARS